MSHSNQPEYYTISHVCPCDGSTTSLGIFEDMEAVSYRLRRCCTSCGDEYRVECHHLSTAASELESLDEQQLYRETYKRKEAEKEAKLKEYDEWKGQIKKDAELPDIKAAYKTVGIA